MNYSKEHIDNLVNGILPMLNEAFTYQRKRGAKTGAELMALGTYTTETGQGIIRNQTYNIVENVATPVDHEANIRSIISKAKKENQVNDQLAKYLRRYGKGPDSIKKQ